MDGKNERFLFWPPASLIACCRAGAADSVLDWSTLPVNNDDCVGRCLLTKTIYSWFVCRRAKIKQLASAGGARDAKDMDR